MSVTATPTAARAMEEQNERELARREREGQETAERLLAVTKGFCAMKRGAEQRAAYKWLGEYFGLS